MSSIHPTCFVHPDALLGCDVQLGPFCVVEADAQIGDGCKLESHVVVKSGTCMGSDNYVAESVVLGGLPQHKQAIRHPGRLIIGDRNTLREHVTIHRGLTAEAETRLGNSESTDGQCSRRT